MAGLGALALLVVGSQLVAQWSIDQASSDGAVVNLSGRQRMLSQRITKDVFALASAELMSTGSHEKDLRESID